MRSKFAQHPRMQQKMALTPQMRQSIQLLSMTTKELNEYIDDAVEQNPILKKDFETRTHIDTSADYSRIPMAQQENPRLSLLSHIRTLDLNDKDLEIAEYLIYEMDENGYLKVDVAEVAKNFFVSTDEVEKVLTIIQSMDPPGIGARDLQECLQLQLKRMKKEDSLEYAIIKDFINELVGESVKKISRALKIEERKVQEAIKNIKKLNPRPASTLLSKQAEPVIPDLIANIKKDKIRLELNREWLPRLRLYNPYKNQLDMIKDPEVKEFLKKNMNTAKHLLDGLKRREETMCRVADYILKFQQKHLVKDTAHLDTLTISDVAKALNLHPSTISRTVSNKYIQINDKVIPLKTFLSHSIKKENGELVSKTSIKSRIKELVNHEDKSRPLSDNAIKEKLGEEGIKIERRTVAKYRESLRILPTHLRRKRV